MFHSMKENFSKIIRYGAVTAISYISLLFGVYVGVHFFSYEPTLVYLVVLTLVYVGVYFSSAYFVFEAKHHSKQWLQYVLSVLLFWLLNTVLYYLLVEQLNMHYLVSAVVNILLFGPIRFFVYKNVVFKL